MSEENSFWVSAGSRELAFIKGFAREIEETDLDGPDMQQLRALWTAYCIHQNMMADTLPYDRELWQIHGVATETKKDFADWDSFELFMCKDLV